MSKEIYISSTPHETRLAIVENEALAEIYYERENEYTLAGSIYNGRVTRVLPGMQSSFVDIGLERDAFLYITDFMEEAGDSADFESGSTAASGESRGERRDDRSGEGDRAPRAERSDRNGRRDRGNRNGSAAPERDRPSTRDTGARDAAARDSSPRDSSQARDTASADTSVFDIEELETGSPVLDRDAVNQSGASEGEGAPGADGSRRWRGRRGRRRGRGEAESSPVASASRETGNEFAAPVQPEQETAAPFDDAPLAVDETSPVREERGRGHRGGKEREGRGRRDGRREESVRERSAPRTGRGYDDESTNAVDLDASAAEPFILPGESLSKYRRNADGTPESAPAAPTPLAARPAAAFELAGAWDGGAVLPGETLSRRRDHAAGHDDGRSEHRTRDDRGMRGDRERNRRSDRPARREAELTPAEAVQPAVTSHHEPEPFDLPTPPTTMTFEPEPSAFEQPEASFSAPVEDQAVAKPAVEATADQAASDPETQVVLEAVDVAAPDAEGDYEPEDDAAVSFRVDPVPPSEFRQSAPPVVIEEVVVSEQVLAPVFQADEEDTLGDAPATAAIPAAAAEAPIDAASDMEFQESGSHSLLGEFTAIQDSGEMLSAPAEPVLHAFVADEAFGDSPVEHEAAVQSVTLQEAERAATLVPQQFAPGDGELEEELLDDEEADPLTLQASSFDDFEEETLDHGADLGSMIRDMSIDQITAPVVVAGADDDEDDYDIDEEDLEEDRFDNGEEPEDNETGEDAAFADGDSSESIEEHEESDGREAAARDAQPVIETTEGGDRRLRRDGGRRGNRDRNGRDRRPGGRSSGSGGGGDRRPSRHSAQTTDLPAISDLLKPGQELLVQIAKEPIAKKGARITSHIALPGRFLVFMPTVNHIGVSRKIDSDGERRRLKEVLLAEKGDASGGFIVRTAAASASDDELRSDLRFLLNLWADIKARSEASKSPALIYHDLNLVERILRDQVTDTFSAIWVDTEDAYERVLRFLQRFQPNLIRRVKLYTKDTPLFEQFGISQEIDKALRSKVWLKSGGSIVINQTEALVAIDINTGKYVGKTARLEDTIVKTNLDAIPEIVRQIRLRDLGGIIIIDFIDMDERKNRHKVMAALEEELKTDRAPSKVLQFNDFGLVAITRKRVKQSLERTLSTTCGVCQGTGMVKSPITVCNDIYVEMRKMQKHLDRGDVMLRVNPEVVKQLKSPGAKWLGEMEEMVGKTILIKSDPSLHPEQFDIH